MMATFYSFKNKANEPEPLIKRPGEIDGQMFDIADCDNVTLVILDNSEQVQIDQVKNSRIFIGACTSSIFIRNCENCVFYTCCRQLRLRDVVNSNFYIYSMSEVHIEFSSGLKFAPFNGGYPEHSRHLEIARLDAKNNLWYDIFDHNDPSKSNANWSLIPENEYEEPWFPAGIVEPAIGRTKPGSVVRVVEGEEMQSFSFHQLVADAQTIAASSPVKTALITNNSPTKVSTISPVPTITLNVDEAQINLLIQKYANYKAGDDLSVSYLFYLISFDIC